MKLNGATIPDAIVERVVARRGAEHSFADLDPKRTALVVIDLQHAFMNDAVGHAVCPAARDIVPAVNRLAAAVRAAGGGVFWIKMTHDERCLDEWSVAHRMASPEMREKRIDALSEGSLGQRCGRSRRAAGRRDRQQIPLQRVYARHLELPERLRARGFDTVLITGTSPICAAKARRATRIYQFRTIMVSDGNAANSQAEHDASLAAFYNTFGDVMDRHGHRLPRVRGAARAA